MWFDGYRVGFSGSYFCEFIRLFIFFYVYTCFDFMECDGLGTSKLRHVCLRMVMYTGRCLGTSLCLALLLWWYYVGLLLELRV